MTLCGCARLCRSALIFVSFASAVCRTWTMSSPALLEVEDLIAKLHHLDLQHPDELLQKRLGDLKNVISAITALPSSSGDSTVYDTGDSAGHNISSSNLDSAAPGLAPPSQNTQRFPFVPVPVPTGEMRPSLTGAPSVHFSFKQFQSHSGLSFQRHRNHSPIRYTAFRDQPTPATARTFCL